MHLAGESISGGTLDGEAARRGSRTAACWAAGTWPSRWPCLPHAPAVAICSSATGYYGDRGDEVLNENLAPRRRASSQRSARRGRRRRRSSCRWGAACRCGRAWCSAATAARWRAWRCPSASSRAARSARGDSGSRGSTATTLCGLIRFALAHAEVSGVVNATAPEQLLNRDLAKLLGKILRMPSFLPAPAFALRLALGEMADELLLSSQRVVPERATGFGYKFALPASGGGAPRGAGRVAWIPALSRTPSAARASRSTSWAARCATSCAACPPRTSTTPRRRRPPQTKDILKSGGLPGDPAGRGLRDHRDAAARPRSGERRQVEITTFRTRRELQEGQPQPGRSSFGKSIEQDL